MLRYSIILLLCCIYTANSLSQELKLSFIAPKCHDGDDGEISISILNGTPMCRLIVEDSSSKSLLSLNLRADTSFSISGLTAQEYKVLLVSDADTIQKLIVINEPEKLKANKIEVLKEPTSSSKCDGELKVNPTGGTKPYTYVWNKDKKKDAEIFKKACSQVQRCTINDANKCGEVEVAYPLFL